MNCKIIFGTAEKFDANHFSKLTDLSQMLEIYDYSVLFRASEYNDISYSDEIKSSFAKNELTVALVSGSTFKASSFTNSILKSIKVDSNNSPLYLTDEKGACYGLCIITGKNRLIILAGVFSDFADRALNSLGAFLAHSSQKAVASCTINVFGISADAISEAISPIMNTKELTVSIMSRQDENCHLRIFASTKTKEHAIALLNHSINYIYKALGKNIYGMNTETLPQKAVDLIRNNNGKISTAESCTGGLVSKLITDIPGSSDVFEFGIEAYSNRIKIEALGIDEKIIETHGAVSHIVAAKMAQSVMNIGESQIGVGITGVAGPASSEGKPVGTVYIALTDGVYTWVRHLSIPNSPSREEVRDLSALTALDLVRRYYELKSEGVLNEISAPGEVFVTDAQPACDINKIVESNNNTNTVDKETISADCDNKKEHTFSLKKKVTKIAQKIKGYFSSLSNKVINKINTIKTEKDTEPEKEQKDQRTTPQWVIKWSNFVSKCKLNTILPVSTDALKVVIGKFAIILSVIVFLVSSIFIINDKIDNKKQTELINELRTKWAEQSNSETDQTGKFTSFNLLENYNKDTVGWLRVAGTEISYPVVSEEGSGSDYYDTRNFLGNKSKFGTLHTNLTRKITAYEDTKNIVIHGNNCSDESMFGTLENFRNIKYYQSYSRISLKTLYKQQNYKIFAIFVINTDPAHDNGYLFDYTCNQFDDDTAFLAWTQEAVARSIITTKVDIKPNDKVLTLATDIDDFEDARLVVMARSVRYDETYSVDETDSAFINPKPLYPQIWYDLKGGSSPYGKVTSGMFDGTESSIGIITEITGSNNQSTEDDLGTTSYETSRFSDTTQNGQTQSVITGIGAVSSKPNDTSSNSVSSSAVSSQTVSSKPESVQETTSSNIATSSNTSSEPVSSEQISSESVSSQNTEDTSSTNSTPESDTSSIPAE